MVEFNNFIKLAKEVAETDPFILQLILFGSYARGEQKITSDIDIAIVSDEPTKVGKKQLRAQLDDLDFEFDLVLTTPNLLENPRPVMDVNYKIREEGIVIYERER